MAAATRASKSASLTSPVALIAGSGVSSFSAGATSVVGAGVAWLAVLAELLLHDGAGSFSSTEYFSCGDNSPGSTRSATVLRVVSLAVSCSSGSRGISMSPVAGAAVGIISYEVAAGSGSLYTGIKCGCADSGAEPAVAGSLISAGITLGS